MGAFCERCPPHVTVILDEAYVEFQADDDPDASLDLLDRLPEPGRPAHVLQVLRPGRAAGRLRDRLRRTSAPRSTRCASRSASTPSPRRPAAEAILHQDDVLRRVEGTVVERLQVEEGAGASSGSRPRRPRRTSPGSTSATPTRRRSSPASPSAQIAVRAGTPLGDPGHIRVSYGTAAENDRFLAAMAELLD